MAEDIIRWDSGLRFDTGLRWDSPLPSAPSTPAPLVATKRKGDKPMDFIPSKRADQYLWWKNMSDNIAVEGPKLGLAPADVTAVKALADAQLAAMEAGDAAKVALDGARETERTTTDSSEASIRARVRNWKTLGTYEGSGSEGVLRLRGPSSVVDPLTFKTVLKASVVASQVRVDFTKGGVDAVNIYTRLRGTTGWTKLALDSSSPYYDTRPLTNAAQPESREYMGRGVIDDEEVGVDSDIVSVAFGG